jgi:ubiquinone/menaquinone biosynthesis C-methylase UbiE
MMKSDDNKHILPVFDHFGILAPLYDKVFRPPQVSMLRELLKSDGAHTLLDIGGGTGRCSQNFTDDFPQTIIVDFSHPMLSQTIKYQGLVPVQGAAETLPFADSSIDRIMAIDSFHHFHNRHFASRELLRILAPGGRLVIEEPDIRRLVVKFIALGEKLALMRSHFQTPERIRQYFDVPGVGVTIYENHSANFWVVVDKI